MDKFEQLEEAVYNFGDTPTLIKMHPQDWYEIQKGHATIESITQRKLCGTPVELDYKIPVGEFVIE